MPARCRCRRDVSPSENGCTRSGAVSRDAVPGPPDLLYCTRLTRCVTAREGAYHRHYLWRCCLRRSRSAARSGIRHPQAQIARHLLRTAISLVIESQVIEQAGAGASLDPGQRAEALRLKRLALLGLPQERFPHLVEAANALTDCADEEAYYNFGIELLIVGIESSTPPSPTHSRRSSGSTSPTQSR